MSSYDICPTCKSYSNCQNLGWDGTDKCINYKPQFDSSQVCISTISDNAGFAVGKFNIDESMSNTIQIDRCKRIIFRDKTLDFVFELPEEYYKNTDTIIINGVKFKRVEE